VSFAKEFDAIAEGIRRVQTLDPLELVFPRDGVACALETLSETFEVAYQEGGMRLLGGSEIGIDPEVNDAPAAREPTPPSGSQGGRFRLFVHAQERRVERTRVRLVAFRHGQLYVVQDHH
jgi:hypothetical protein